MDGPLVYVSGYSEPMGHIRGDQLLDGIRTYRLQPDGTLGDAAVPPAGAAIPNPSLVCSDSRGRWLFCVNEIDDGSVSAFAIEPSTGALRLINRVNAHGVAPCHCCVSSDDAFFFCASYGSGTVVSFAIQSDGSLAPAAHIEQHAGLADPHAHSTTMDPSGANLIAVDLGLDQVRRYALGPTGALTLRDTLQMEAGLGSCLFCFDRSGSHAYVGNEYDSSLCHLTYDDASGFATDGIRYSTAPEGKEQVSAAAIIYLPPAAVV